ncbi:conserved Plasmodium protein, unknown function [Plasmodium knowlesi strain H]|nr:conserved Plasmodium protein, unknown function [Plasmodium knowlesi strain H]
MSTYDDNTMEEGGNTQQCDMHDAWITLCQYFNCMQKRDYVNEEDTHSELTVSPNHFVATPNSFCHRNNFFCSEHKEDYSTVNSLDSKKAGGIFCWSASHQRGEHEQCESTQGGEDTPGGGDTNHMSGNDNIPNVHNTASLNKRNDAMGGELPEGPGEDPTDLHKENEENEQGEKQKKYIRIISKGNEESHYGNANNMNASSSLFSTHTNENNNLEDHADGTNPAPVSLYPLINRDKIDRNVIFIQVQNFSQKIDEYISDEKIFRAQKLILHVKKYVEHYISYFKKINDEEAVQMLTNYYEENCTDKNCSYNVNKLKAHIIFYFLNFFRLHEMSNVLQDYSYYFSLDKNNSVSSDTMTHSLDNNTSHTVEENLNMKRKSSAVHFGEHSAANSDEGLPCGLSAMGMSLDGDMSSEQNGEVSGAKIADEKSAQSVDEINAQGDDEINAQGDDEINAQGDDEINAQGDDEINAQGDDEINAQIADDEINAQGDDEKIAQIADDEKSAQRGEIKIGEEPSDEQPGQHWGRGEEAENANERPGDDNPNVRNQDDEEEERKRESQVIVDKVYHHQCNGSSHLSNNRASVTKENSKKEETDLNTKGSNRHMVKIIQKYSRRFKNFRKIKQNKEGWIKENDKYLDLWHRVDSDNNISVHIRGKLPYDVSMILSIISETELSTHWVPFLTSSEKIKSLSKSSALIAQLYEYPIIGKKESLMYGLGANTLEELGCIILCCMCPPELKKDIEFYQNMCEQMNINKNEEILKVKETPLKFRKVKREVTFFDCQLPDPTPKIDRQRAANLCFLIYPLNNGKSTVLELFVHFENEFKYTPIKMVTYFIKKIVKNMYANIIKTCKNYHTIYADRLNTNQEFYLWLNDQIKKYTKSKHQTKFIDSISLESYHEPENNDAL